MDKFKPEEKLKCCGKECKDGKHFQMRMKDMEGVIGKIGKMNSNNIPIPETEVTCKDITRGMGNIMKTIIGIKQDALRVENNKLLKVKDKIKILIRKNKNENYEEFNKQIKEVIKKNKKKNGKMRISERNIHVNEVMKVKKQLKGMVITVLDKATAELYVQCPANYWEKIKNETMDCENLDNITKKMNEKEIMQEIRKDYNKLRLAKKFPMRNGIKKMIPTTYVIPKNKDPINKYRAVTSYFNFPARRLLKLAGKQMYTNLSHEEIKKGIMWLLATMVKIGHQVEIQVNKKVQTGTPD